MFGAVNALFSGLAMAGVIYAVFLQREELSLQRQELKAQREEMSKMVATQVRQLHISIQSLAMECDDIAKVWAFSETADLNFRQSAYVNLVLSHWEMQLGEGLLTPSQVKATLSKYFAESKQFRAFWPIASAHRKTMAEASGGTALAFHTLAQSAYDTAPKP